MTYKQWDKVMYKWELCTYIVECTPGRHLIDWFVNWHAWKYDKSITRAEKNNYTFVWEKYYFVNTDELSQLPKKVTDLWDNEFIHCETEEAAIRICKLMDDAWLKRSKWDSYLNKNNWYDYKQETCYEPNAWLFSNIEYCKRNNYTIHASTDFHTEIKVWDAVFIDDKWLVQKTPTPHNKINVYINDEWIDFWPSTIKQSLTSYTKPIMTKLATFRNKLFFTDKKMQSLAELTQEGTDVASSIQDLMDAVSNIQGRINMCVRQTEQSVEDNNIDSVKCSEKQLKQLLKSIKEDKTMEVLLASAEVVDKFNESL